MSSQAAAQLHVQNTHSNINMIYFMFLSRVSSYLMNRVQNSLSLGSALDFYRPPREISGCLPAESSSVSTSSDSGCVSAVLFDPEQVRGGFLQLPSVVGQTAKQ